MPGRQISLNIKLGGLLLLFTVVLAAITLATFRASHDVTSKVRTVKQRALPHQHRSEALADQFQAIANRFEDAALTGELALLQRNREAAPNFVAQLDRMEQMVDAGERIHLERIRREFDAYDRNADELVRLMLSCETGTEDRIASLADAMLVARARLEPELERLREASRRQVDAKLDSALGRVTELSRRTLIIGSGACLVWLVALVWVRRRLVKPIVELSRLTTRVAQGELHVWLDSGRTGNDELGQLARDFLTMTRGLRETTVSREYVTSIIRSMSGSLIVASEDGTIRTVNRATETLLGYTAEELVGQRLDRVFPAASGARHSAVRPESREGAGTDRTTYLAKDGTEIPVSLSTSILRADNGGGNGAILVAHDIRKELEAEEDRRLLEQQLFQASKLQAVGQLAAGIAHEINTPTQYVGDNVRFLQEGFTDMRKVLDELRSALEQAESGTLTPERIAAARAVERQVDLDYLVDEMPQAITQSLEGVGRVAKIVRAMKEFSHPSEAVMSVDINHCIENTITVARNEWKYVAEMVTELDPELPDVRGVPGGLNQVLLNMIVNAAHAIGDVVGEGGERKGTITIRTRQIDGAVEIEIQDDGAGMAEEVRARIFDPFFTTKEIGRGTGQGLSIAHSVVVQKHGGSIDVESEVGSGTTFRICLPLEGAAGAEEACA